MSRRSDDALIRWLMRLPFRVALLVSAALFIVGLAMPVVIATGQGWVSILALTRPLWWSLTLLVLIFSGFKELRRKTERRIFDSGVAITDLTWEQFEGYLAEFYRRRGTAVTYRGGGGADGGVDLVLDDANGRRIVQAKHWNARSVDVVTVRALWGVREDERADGAVVVTSGTFTDEALRFAEGKALELIDGQRLRRMVAEVKSIGPEFGTTPLGRSDVCPKCGTGRLVRRRARRGGNAGTFFLGCDRFPECRYTRNL